MIANMRAKSPKPRMVRASLQHADGSVTRGRVVLGSPFLLDLETGRYFDLQRGAQYRERPPKRESLTMRAEDWNARVR